MNWKSSLKALFMGWLVDVLGTEASSFTASIIFGAVWMAAGRKLEAATEFLTGSPPVAVAYLVFGLLFTMLGAYVTASLAEREKVRHALGMGFLSELTGLATIALSPRSAPMWYYLISTALVLPIALAGGYLGLAVFRRSGMQRPRHLVPQVLIAVSILSFLLIAALLGLAFMAKQGDL